LLQDLWIGGLARAPQSLNFGSRSISLEISCGIIAVQCKPMPFQFNNQAEILPAIEHPKASTRRIGRRVGRGRTIGLGRARLNPRGNETGGRAIGLGRPGLNDGGNETGGQAIGLGRARLNARGNETGGRAMRCRRCCYLLFSSGVTDDTFASHSLHDNGGEGLVFFSSETSIPPPSPPPPSPPSLPGKINNDFVEFTVIASSWLLFSRFDLTQPFMS